MNAKTATLLRHKKGSIWCSSFLTILAEIIKLVGFVKREIEPLQRHSFKKVRRNHWLERSQVDGLTCSGLGWYCTLAKLAPPSEWRVAGGPCLHGDSFCPHWRAQKLEASSPTFGQSESPLDKKRTWLTHRRWWRASADTRWLCHYMWAPPRVKWEGWGSPKSWRALAGMQALGGHSSRQRCTGRTPQGPQRGCLTGEPGPSMLGTPSVHHLHTHKVCSSTYLNTCVFRCHALYISTLTYENLYRGQRVIFPVHVPQFVLRDTLLWFGTDGVELVPFLHQLLGGGVRHLERLASQSPVQTKGTENHWGRRGRRWTVRQEAVRSHTLLIFTAVFTCSFNSLPTFVTFRKVPSQAQSFN